MNAFSNQTTVNQTTVRLYPATTVTGSTAAVRVYRDPGVAWRRPPRRSGLRGSWAQVAAAGAVLLLALATCAVGVFAAAPAIWRVFIWMVG
jgi:hypothetical protein